MSHNLVFLTLMRTPLLVPLSLISPFFHHSFHSNCIIVCDSRRPFLIRIDDERPKLGVAKEAQKCIVFFSDFSLSFCSKDSALFSRNDELVIVTSSKQLVHRSP